jgi:proline racemase
MQHDLGSVVWSVVAIDRLQPQTPSQTRQTGVSMSWKHEITAVDAHAAGEPGRVITGGMPDIPGNTMFEKRLYLERHADWLRKLMLREPRGYPALCCNVLLPPTDPKADAGFVIMEQTEYPAMSGSNTICVTTVLIETGMVPAVEPVTELTLETPAGLIGVQAEVKSGKVTAVTFENVPAYAAHLDVIIDVPQLGTAMVDIAWGGMFYVIADAGQFGVELKPENGRELTRIGEMLRAAAAEQLPVVHPVNPEISSVSISQLYGPPDHSTARPPDRTPADLRNCVVVSTGGFDWDRPDTWTGAIDRSPCGTGTCAKMATLFARGELQLNQDFRYESLLGTVFVGRLVRETSVGPYPAVIPTLTGTGWITGINRYVLDPSDPFPEGYRIGDLW